MDREKALEMALAQIDKQFGKGSIMRMGENQHASIGIIPTGSLSLDVALGIGGLPRGRVIEIFGAESSGKTTIALHQQGASGVAYRHQSDEPVAGCRPLAGRGGTRIRRWSTRRCKKRALDACRKCRKRGHRRKRGNLAGAL